MAEKMVDIYDPTVDAFRAVPLSVAKTFIIEAKKLEKILVARGDVQPQEIKVD
jgi:hypothetical protein